MLISLLWLNHIQVCHRIVFPVARERLSFKVDLVSCVLLLQSCFSCVRLYSNGGVHGEGWWSDVLCFLSPLGLCLFTQLVGRHPGPGQPSVRPAAEERDDMVSALLLGVNEVSLPERLAQFVWIQLWTTTRLQNRSKFCHITSGKNAVKVRQSLQRRHTCSTAPRVKLRPLGQSDLLLSLYLILLLF